MKRLLIVLPLGIMLAAVAYLLFYQWWIHNQLQSERDAMRALGLPGTLGEISAWHTARAPEPNAVTALRDAYETFMHSVCHGREAGSTPFIGPEWGMTEDGENVEPWDFRWTTETLAFSHDALGCWAGVMEQFREVNRGGELLLMPLVPELGGDDGELLAFTRHGARLFALQAAYSARTGDATGAAASMLDGIAFSRKLGDECNLISALVRIACEEIMLDALKMVLATKALTAEQLNEIESALTDDFRLQPHHFVEDFCVNLDNPYKQSLSEIYQYEGFPKSRDSFMFYIRVIFLIVTKEKERADLKQMQALRQFAELAASDAPDKIDAAKALSPQATAGPHGHEAARQQQQMMESRSASVAVRAFVAVERAAAKREAARAAVVLEKYRLTTGALPSALAELEEQLSTAPLSDPFTGGEFGYLRYDDGFNVYSLGENKQDNGGLHYREMGDKAAQLAQRNAGMGVLPAEDDLTFIVRYYE